MAMSETYYKSVRVGDSEAHLGAVMVSAILRPFTPGEDAVTAWITSQDTCNLLDMVHLKDGRDLCVFERLYHRESYERARACSDAFVTAMLSRIPKQHATTERA